MRPSLPLPGVRRVDFSTVRRRPRGAPEVIFFRARTASSSTRNILALARRVPNRRQPPLPQRTFKPGPALLTLVCAPSCRFGCRRYFPCMTGKLAATGKETANTDPTVGIDVWQPDFVLDACPCFYVQKTRTRFGPSNRSNCIRRTITTVQGLTLYRHRPTFQIIYLIDPPSHAPRPREPISTHDARYNIVYAS